MAIDRQIGIVLVDKYARVGELGHFSGTIRPGISSIGENCFTNNLTHNPIIDENLNIDKMAR